MAGTLLERKLTARRNCCAEFAVATQADDAEIRRLLRENPIPGRISLSLEREPDYFADARVPGEIRQTVIARENRRIVCVGSCVVRQRFINGEPRCVGYLGGLRLDASQAGRFDVVRRGYEFFRELQTEAPADFYFTSIAADNERARTFLERGLPGMPQYEFVGEFVTVLLSTDFGPSSYAESQPGILFANEVVARLNEQNSFYQLAPTWSANELVASAALGLEPHHFSFIRRNGRIVAGAAVWDQRTFKQAVIRGYAAPLTALRPAYNFGARAFGWPQLPNVGVSLSNAFLSHVVANADEQDTLIQSISELRRAAAQRGIKLLTMGFAVNDLRLAAVRRHFRNRIYRSRLYVVRWLKIGGAAGELNNSVLAPEVALL